MSRNIAPAGKISLSDIEKNRTTGGKLLFTSVQHKKSALLIRDNRLRAAAFFPEKKSQVGAVYLAKVRKAVPNLNAYFVMIASGAEEEVCFLAEKEAEHPFLLNRDYDGRILAGDEFPVQIIRDAYAAKQAAVTTNLSLSNDYFVLSVGRERTGYSNKLTDSQKQDLAHMLQKQGENLPLPQIFLPRTRQGVTKLPIGLVVRTQAAELLNRQECTEEVEMSAHPFPAKFHTLCEQFDALFQRALHQTCFSCLRPASADWENVLEHLVYPYEYEEIITDIPQIYEELCAYRNQNPEKPIRFYDEEQSARLSLCKLYGLESKLDTALERRVWLKSGGYLIIDPTEAMTVIDVNSGKYDATRDKEESILRINQEAAEEVALQLRLRNLSGMILVDFINMKSKEHQEELLNTLRKLVKEDKQKTVVVDMTPLGIVEITRQKRERTLAEQLRERI